jgi:hypothetical protein
MARGNIGLLAFNRGLVSPKSLARVDLDRMRLSAAKMTNWLPKTQGAMRIRPGTKHLGSSINDTGAEWIEFVAATDDTALIELTHQKMRIWIDDALLERPSVATTLSLADTGWSNVSTGGGTSITGTSTRTFDAGAIGSLARLRRRVIVDTGDANVEHSLALNVSRGEITLRCGSDTGSDDYIGETALGTGYHNLAFTPTGTFYVTLQSDKMIDRLVAGCSIGDTGTVEITTFIDAADLSGIRYDQSADVVYVDCDGVEPNKIERRGTGRSWSFVKYRPDNGPFLSAATSAAKLTLGNVYGNITMLSDIPLFTSGRVGSLVRVFHNGQGNGSTQWLLGDSGAITDAIEVTGVGDTGTPGANSARRLAVSVVGTWAGTAEIQRSFAGPETGFIPVPADFISVGATDANDTGSINWTIDDRDDNVTVWYRIKLTRYTSGVASVGMSYKGGGVSGIARITGYTSSTSVSAEVLKQFSDNTLSDTWQFGAWSTAQGFPSAVAIHEGRLGHAGDANIHMSVSDDYENFDDTVEGDAGPISRTFGSGPVDNIHYLVSLLRLIAGTSGSEIAIRSSSLDETLTPTNAKAQTFSTQGSANLRPLRMDTNAIFVQRSQQRVFVVGPNNSALSDYAAQELTMLVPELLEAGVVSIAIQRQPDTRIHCVLANGKVAILTYEPQEEVICWSMWETDGTVERAAVLPGTNEDQVYYHVNRVINGVTKRFLEKWATEAESEGDTGLSWLADCAKSYTDTGRATVLTGFSHLVGESVVIWADDTGQTYPGKDLSPDVAGVQTTYVVDTGAGTVTLSQAVHHAVVGLPYTADWTSTKLAYSAQAGTALAQMKRTDKVGFVLHNTHNNGLYFGSDTGNLDPLPRVTDEGAEVDQRKVYPAFDQAAMPFPGLWSSDSRIHLRAKAPRPCTVLAAIPTVNTSEKV